MEWILRALDDPRVCILSPVARRGSSFFSHSTCNNHSNNTPRKRRIKLFDSCVCVCVSISKGTIDNGRMRHHENNEEIGSRAQRRMAWTGRGQWSGSMKPIGVRYIEEMGKSSLLSAAFHREREEDLLIARWVQGTALRGWGGRGQGLGFCWACVYVRMLSSKSQCSRVLK